MVQEVAIHIKGTEKTVKSTQRKVMQMIYRNIDILTMATGAGSASLVAENILIKSRGRVSNMKLGRGPGGGGIWDNLTKKRLGNGKYLVYVKTPQRWGSDRSIDSRKIYPLAQETSYRPHKIYYKWMPANSKLRQSIEQQGGPYWIKVRQFTPYLIPAYVEVMNYDAPNLIEKAMNKELEKMMKRIRRKSVNSIDFAEQEYAAEQAFVPQAEE
jgi:hypothetical protein